MKRLVDIKNPSEQQLLLAACDYAGARMLTVSGSTLAWMVRFRTGRLIRKVPS